MFWNNRHGISNKVINYDWHCCHLGGLLENDWLVVPHGHVDEPTCRWSVRSSDWRNRGLHTNEKITCNECGYQTSYKETLTKHKQVLHEGKGYRCGSCEYMATEKGILTKHKQSRHEGKKYPCESCDYQASTRGTLTNSRYTKATPVTPVTTRQLPGNTERTLA